MEKKLLKIMLVVLGIILILIVFYILFFVSFKPSDLVSVISSSNNIGKTSQNVTSNDSITTAGDLSGSANNDSLVVRDKQTDSDLARTAASFAERFGSFSNQSNFKNIENLRIFMTDKMQIWADQYVSDMRKSGSKVNDYYGITTKAIIQEITELDEAKGQAKVLVKTKRRESYGERENITNSFDQDIILNFVKVNGLWKVDSAAWQN